MISLLAIYMYHLRFGQYLLLVNCLLTNDHKNVPFGWWHVLIHFHLKLLQIDWKLDGEQIDGNIPPLSAFHLTKNFGHYGQNLNGKVPFVHSDWNV